MTVLWQSSWFWLMICTLLLILVGCTLFNGRSLNPRTDNSNLITLTNTPFPTFIPHDIDQIPFPAPFTFNTDYAESYERSNPPPPEIMVDNPTCYSLSSGEFSCLGQIWNNSDNNLGDTQLKLEFFDEIGQKIGEQTTTSEQRLIESGFSAPYRTIVNADLANQMDAETRILSSVINELPPAANIRTLSIADARGDISDAGRYNLTLTIQNNSGFDAQDIRLFTTLDGEEWGIIGYNIHEVENILLNGEQQLLEVEVIPHAIPRRIEHILHVEALISE